MHNKRILQCACALLAVCVFTAHSVGQDGASFEHFEPATDQGQTYYTSPRGSDENDGLSTHSAFATLQRAADVAEPGDTVLVMRGRYRKPGVGATVLFISKSGTPDKWITFKAYPGHRPSIEVGQHWGGITIGGASYVLIDGINVFGERKSISLEYALAEMSNLNNPITSGNGISVTKGFYDSSRMPHHIIIRNCKVGNCPGGGIGTMYADYVRIENNISVYNAWYSPYANSGISIYKAVSYDSTMAPKIVVRDNISNDNQNLVPNYYSSPSDPTKRRISDGNGIIIDDLKNLQHTDVPPYKGMIILDGNRAQRNGGRGIVLYNSENAIVCHNNTRFDGTSDGMDSEFSVNGCSNVAVFRNSIRATRDNEPIEAFGNVDVTFEDNIVR